MLREVDKRREVLLGRRHADMHFMPGYYVFPGGKLESGDHAEASKNPIAHSIGGPYDLISSEDATAHAIAAARECREETGLAIPEIHFSNLRCIAQAITPEGSPIRFNTRFFLVDGACTRSEGSPSGELEYVGWYDIDTALRSLRTADVTQFVLHEALTHWPIRGHLSQNHVTVPVMTYDASGPIVTRPVD